MEYTLRIKKNKTFRAVLKKGKFFREKHLVVHILKCRQDTVNINYFGVCVSKKNGNSVQRNKLKRWAREVYTKEEMNLKKGYNIVIIYKKGVGVNDLNFQIVKNEVISCLKGLKEYDK
ncbi:MAG: ribonuclease P protein component [Clostridia bacterium]